MTATTARVALLGDGTARGLAAGLVARSQVARVISSDPPGPFRLVERRLRSRLYEDRLVHVPFAYLALSAGNQDIAHATHVADGLAALRWSRRTGRPAVLTYSEVPDRQTLCARRRRLEITEKVTAGCTVVATSEEVAAGLRRWLGVDARVIEPEPGSEAVERYLVLYGELLCRELVG